MNKYVPNNNAKQAQSTSEAKIQYESVHPDEIELPVDPKIRLAILEFRKAIGEYSLVLADEDDHKILQTISKLPALSGKLEGLSESMLDKDDLQRSLDDAHAKMKIALEVLLDMNVSPELKHYVLGEYEEILKRAKSRDTSVMKTLLTLLPTFLKGKGVVQNLS